MAHSPNVVANYLLSCATYNADGEVIVCGDRRVTWSTLVRRVMSLARGLIGLGVRPRETVALVLHNRVELIEANYAIQVAGAIPTPLNYRFTADELQQQIAHSDARLVIYEPCSAAAVEGALAALGPQAPRAVFVADDGQPVARPPTIAYAELGAGEEADDPAIPTTLEDVAAMIYTGGTTGRPKGALLTYGAFVEMFACLLAGMVRKAGELQLSDEQRAQVADAFPMAGVRLILPLLRFDRVRRWLARPRTEELARAALRRALTRPEIARLGYRPMMRYMTPSMPFFHSASYQMLMLGLMVGKICFTLTPGPGFDPATVLETVQRERPAFLANVPIGWRKLLAFPDLARYDTSSVRVAATGTGVCSIALKREIFDRFPGIIIVDLFGQTEMTPLTAFRIDTSAATLKERSVGRAIVELRIVDDQGREVAQGEVGEVCYRSRTTMRGYHKDPAGTAAALADGWFRSGDLGCLDDEGDLRVVDRVNECINTGGEKVFPLEVEEVLQQHAAVEECCVFGVPDERWGSLVRAAVKLRADHRAVVDELLEHCRSRIAAYKVPKTIVFVDALPRSTVGKVLRAEARKL
jgi:acyl-CoA synthetase (AMP-forming)/AMP-acid ligase II